MGGLAVLVAGLLAAAPFVGAGLADYLPSGVTYDPEIPPPAAVLGFGVGEWHARPDQVARYCEVLAAASDRVRLEIQGRTHEQRPLPLLILTSADNQRRLEEIRRDHLALAEPGGPEPRLDAMPVVVLLGYSVHGNEASGANAALLVAYHLAAARDEEVEGLLAEAVILLDPSLNPDGLGRFAHWANTNRGTHPVAAPSHREHNEAWPGGRTNHYLFDLNRDYLLLQQPETRARIETWHHWKPNLVGDYHEMGSDATFFFQPGVPTRINPWIPTANQELTRRIAAYHAAALDALGSLYYSEETFDDFYPGKGSTYPDLNGGVGVLFEQASARGHLRETANGLLSFPFAIRHQFATSLSLLRAAREQRRELLRYQARFFAASRAEAAEAAFAAYVVAVPGDPARAFHLLELLAGHRIAVHRLAAPVTAGGRTFDPSSSVVVPLDQPQYRLLRALFDRRTRFEDTTFYDVSAWTLPLAFNAPYAELERRELGRGLLGERLQEPVWPAAEPPAADPAYAWLFRWQAYYAPRALNRLLAAGFRPRVASRELTVETGRGRQRFGAGSIVVPAAAAAEGGAELGPLLERIAREDGVELFAATTGLTPDGADLGSPELPPVKQPQPLLVVGEGISGYEAGEVWHLLDHRFGIEVALVDRERLAGLDLAPFTHLLLVDGDYSALAPEVVGELHRWVTRGGTLVATKGAAAWAGDVLLTWSQEAPVPPPPEPGEPAPPPPAGTERPAYADFPLAQAAQLISGAILAVDLDLTHPLAFGYAEPRLPVFRNSTLVLEPSPNPWENPGRYPGTPLLAGYASAENLEKIAGSAALIAGRLGQGTVVRIADNPNFRGFFYGTSKLYLNALFFGPLIRETPPPERWE